MEKYKPIYALVKEMMLLIYLKFRSCFWALQIAEKPWKVLQAKMFVLLKTVLFRLPVKDNQGLVQVSSGYALGLNL